MAKNITVYSTPTCPWCKILKKFLDEPQTKYTEKNVSTDQQAATEMFEKTQQRGVPVTDIDGTIIIGFDKQQIEDTLKE